ILPLPLSPLFPYTTLFRSVLKTNPPAFSWRLFSASSSVSALTDQVLVILKYFTRTTSSLRVIPLLLAETSEVPTSRQKNYSSFRSEEHTSELQSPYDLVCR